MPPGDAEVQASLKRLRAEQEDWAVQHLPVTELAWEAFRHHGRYPVSGGVGWIRAESAERLGAMIAAVQRMEAEVAAGQVGRP